MMSKLQLKYPTDTWVTASWDEYLQAIENLENQKTKAYYYKGELRFEMSTVDSDHARDHAFIIVAVSLFAGIKGIFCSGKDSCTYRKTGMQEIQPDVSYHIGENADIIPWGTSIVDLDIYPPPNLVIEVANTSLADDKGEKRLLYEDLQVQEYWIIDVQNVQVIAFKIESDGSRRIKESEVLPGLKIAQITDAFERTRRMNQTQVIAWLLEEFQQQ